MMQVKVIFDPTLLKSEQTLAEAIYRLQSQEANFFFSRKWCNLTPAPSTPGPVSSEIYLDGLLRPPDFGFVEIDDDEGEMDPIIFITAAEGVGKIDIFVCVLDEDGNVVARGPAFYIPGSGTEWGFAIEEPVASGAPVHVSIHAFDCVGGVRVGHYDLTIP
jgi:hypothetical protein